MRELTETEKKVADVFEKVMKDAPAVEPGVIPLIQEISTASYGFENKIPGAIVIFMPSPLLIHAKLQYAEIIKELKKVFVNTVVLFSRNEDIKPIRGHNPSRRNEAVIQDLVFPSVVVGRLTDVISRDDMCHEVLIESKSQRWAKPELATIEHILSKMFEANFRIKTFTAGAK